VAYTLYKLVGQLLMPLPLALGLVALLWWLDPPGAPWIGPLILGLLAVLSTPAAGGWLRRRVERRGVGDGAGCGGEPEELPEVDALVVLSGGFPHRDLWGLTLLRRGKAPMLLFSGRTSPGTALARNQLIALAGVEPQRLLFEPASRSTVEGGRAFRTLAAERGWRSVLLVSDAYHLARARRDYGTEGVRVMAAPFPAPQQAPTPPPSSEGRPAAAQPLDRRVLDLVPSVEGLAGSTLAVRELLGVMLRR
jgi:uncharacterized SAM-binding protein YcdF (DUF218 family)